MKACASGLVTILFRMTCVLFLIAAASPHAGYAAGLMDVYDLAVKNDPLLQGAHYQHLAKNEEERQALAGLLPTVSAFGTYTKTHQKIKDSENDVYDSGSTEYDTKVYGLSLTQPLFRWDSIVNYKQSQLKTVQAELEYHVFEIDLMVRVAGLYLDILSARNQLTSIAAEQTAVEKHYELATNRQQMGLVPITDLHDAKARLASVQAKYLEAENQLDDAVYALTEVTGETLSDLAELEETMPRLVPDPQNVDTWIESGLKHNPALLLKRSAVKLATKEVSKRKSAHMPTLDLVGSYSDEDTEGSLFGGGSEVADLELALELKIPLYSGGGASSKVRQARQYLNYAKAELTRQERQVRREVRASYLGVITAVSKLEALEQSLVASRSALEAKQEGFNSGLYTSLAVLDAERDLAIINIEYGQARYDYLLNCLKLEQAAGSLELDDLVKADKLFK